MKRARSWQQCGEAAESSRRRLAAQCPETRSACMLFRAEPGEHAAPDRSCGLHGEHALQDTMRARPDRGHMGGFCTCKDANHEMNIWNLLCPDRQDTPTTEAHLQKELISRKTKLPCHGTRCLEVRCGQPRGQELEVRCSQPRGQELEVLCGQPRSRTSFTVHGGIRCDACGMAPLVGTRFTSVIRAGLDLCQWCRGRCKDWGDPLATEQFVCIPDPGSWVLQFFLPGEQRRAGAVRRAIAAARFAPPLELIVHACEVAALAGMSKRCCQEQATSQWLARHPEKAAALGLRTPRRSPSSVLEAELDRLAAGQMQAIKDQLGLPRERPAHAVARRMLQELAGPAAAASCEAESAEAVQEALAAMVPMLAAVPGVARASEVAARMQRGVAREASCLDAHFEAVTHRNVRCHKRELPWRVFDPRTGRRVQVVVVGRIDGMEAGGSRRVVEVKNRRRRLMHQVPQHERVQVEAYMWLTDSRRRGAVHIERHDSDAVTTHITHIPALWAEVEQRLEAWVRLLLFGSCEMQTKTHMSRRGSTV
ncbi:hypothetical protein CYMTET_55765 [Cymbomonas tetramitiformis]|uniref:Uncharacterized protein n=1 Tax=Cymbomonas tetramitiformis TaxID=36881 RepID=A0AAE0EN17_9CHLO|nr:hypothetical protein CYMTET_55765 [Cymbomonas tetramitiformis]